MIESTDEDDRSGDTLRLTRRWKDITKPSDYRLRRCEQKTNRGRTMAEKKLNHLAENGKQQQGNSEGCRQKKRIP